MYERKFADSYDMNMKKIHNMIRWYIADAEETNFYCKEDEARIDELKKRLDSILIDHDFKMEFIDDLQDSLYYVSLNSFDNGLEVGLSLLKNLLTAEPPEINVIHKEVPTEKDEFIEDFSRIYESLPLRERMYLMTKIYEYEEKYNENGTLTENEET
ncbi:MAG: hypothetical protein K2J40_02775 [Ruminococcus sp.]|nr:hypothetical protein [Ruminococcus sp.]